MTIDQYKKRLKRDLVADWLLFAGCILLLIGLRAAVLHEQGQYGTMAPTEQNEVVQSCEINIE